MLDSLKFVGKPCFRGHDGTRYIKGHACVQCALDRAKTRDREKYLAYLKQWRKDNAGTDKTSNMPWIRKNRAKWNAMVAERESFQRGATPKWANRKLMKKFYENCPEGYEVDHIVPLVSDLVCGLHCEGNLQYLTQTENRSKGNRFWPDMPC